ncbi:phospholipase D-like domain-containing protein [Rufibacter hautae]|uniref:hypothetical protein n=1 Tax=Rufibacter hautae TaxID=2595005 RepID=UPI001CC2062F|nr:hypothetical protein [Rufibacter hautae]
MALQRQNILDLIGKNRHKYSSCIITCFSFDFTFFEERVMTALRLANVRNVNVLVDGKFLEQSLEMVTGNEFKNHKTYSLTPVYETGVFHPKIMLLTGPTQGLLVIGSGNLTSSGLSTNDEIWAAFHLNSLDCNNAPVFAAAWQYLQGYFPQVKGFNQQKLDWITQYSPWVRELALIAPGKTFIPLDDELEVKFVANTASVSIYQQLIESLPKSKVKKLSIVSPYFDEKGTILEQLTADFEIEEIACLTDQQFGILPTKLNEILYNQVAFYDWKDCLKDFDTRYNRLHAKLFHFEYTDGWEYLLIGSPNATIQALGSVADFAVNGEAGLLLKRKNKNGYIRELGINTKNGPTLNVKAAAKGKTHRGDSTPSINYENKILYAERNGSRLTVHLKKTSKAVYEIQVLNSSNEEVEIHSLPAVSEEAVIILQQPDKAFRLFLVSDGVRVSNYSLIHNISYLVKSTPDPSHDKLTQIIEGFLADPENGIYSDLLKYIDYSVDEEEFGLPAQPLRGASGLSVSTNTTIDHIGLTEEELYKLRSAQARDLLLLNTSNVQIADILNIISKGMVVQSSEVQENAEQALSQDDIEFQMGSEQEVDQSVIKRARGEAEQRAIFKHLDKIDKFFSNQHKKFFETRMLQDVPKRPITLKELSNVSVMTDLLYMFYGKSYNVSTIEVGLYSTNKTKPIIQELEKEFGMVKTSKINRDNFSIVYFEMFPEYYLEFKKRVAASGANLLVNQEEFSPITRSYPYFFQEDLKSILIETFGCFLLCANSKAGFHQYTNESQNEKVIFYRDSIFRKCTFLILNIRWREDELVYRDILLLDLLQLVCPDKLSTKYTKELKLAIEDLYKSNQLKSEHFSDNLKYYFSSLIPTVQSWQRIFETDSSSLSTNRSSLGSGTIIYHRELGFATLKQSGNNFITLVKPCLPWDDYKGENTMKIVYPLTNIILFKN